MNDTNARILADYRPSDYSILTTDLIFELFDEQTIVTNTMRLRKTNDQSTKLFLDGEHLFLKSIAVNGELLTEEDYQVTESDLSFFPKENEFSLTIVTQINPTKNTALEGLFKSGDAFCTQCEAEGFRRITYYLDRPDVMAKFITKIIADKTQYPFLLSNGNKIDSGDLNNGLHFVTWQDPFLKPCYLFALVAGDFDVLEDTFITKSNREVALEIFVDKGNIHKADHAMKSLQKSMKWDEDVFGLEYDLDIYMIVAVDFFNMGAMENKGLNVFNSKFVLADEKCATDTDYFNVEAVIAHEYFHNWTGNRVTCRDWFQLSLKEGLTVFRDQQFSGDMHSKSVTRIQNVRVLRAQQFAEDAGPMSHPIRPEKVIEMNNFYTLTVYEKGAEVIRMIHTLLGEKNFRKGTDLYFKRFDGMAVTCDDFVDAMSDASNVDLTQFKKWYSQSGTPEITVQEQYNEVENEFTLILSQANVPSKNQPIKHDLLIPIKLELLSDNNKEQHLLYLKETSQTFVFSKINSKPTVAFLSDFSAPVKVKYEQASFELETIILEASDPFNRWDAGQKLLTQHITAILENEQYKLPEQLLEIFSRILISDGDDALKAEQLTLPNFDELVDKYENIDPIKLLNALDKIRLFIANGLMNELMQKYEVLAQSEYQNDGKSIGERALKNVILSYLSILNTHSNIPTKQYQLSDNMTDTLAALNCMAKNVSEHFKLSMADFEKRWSTTTLVMDKWFSIQASLSDKNIFNNLDEMEKHPLFTLKNPNRARSLIAAFAHFNPRYFHCESGRGYQFLSKHIKALNTINPQIASRLITPLIQFKNFDLKRQTLMKQELIAIANLDNLSKDLKEKLDAALN